MRSAICCALIIVATVAAAAFRVPLLKQRPMHTDEAVHAYKFGELLQENHYRYDPFEYHGPTLNYLTLVPALLSGAETLSEINEITLRLVPAAFGILLIPLLLPLRKALGGWTLVCAATFTAVSPSMVFYSRYYIMEILLVAFTASTLVCGYRFSQHQRPAWAILTGISLGLMHATKETCIIAWGALGLSLAALILLQTRQGTPVRDQLKALNWPALSLGLAAALLTSLAFFSSFGTNPAGILDSIATYGTYFNRAGAGAHSSHEQPPLYYLGLLAHYQFAGGPTYSEGLILLLALLGIITALRGPNLPGINQGLLRFIAIYTLLLTCFYSVISYKTPWCLLGFHHGLILLAGAGAARLLQLKSRPLRITATALLLLGTAHLATQAHSSSFTYDSDARNPYVYAHTGKDIFPIVNRIKEMAQAHPDGTNTHIQIACPNGDYWPLPWYLRNYQVEFTSTIDTNTPAAPIILIQPPLEPDLMTKLYEVPPPGQRNMYMFLFYDNGAPQYRELRPQIELRGFVTKELWDRFELARATPHTNPP